MTMPTELKPLSDFLGTERTEEPATCPHCENPDATLATVKLSISTRPPISYIDCKKCGGDIGRAEDAERAERESKLRKRRRDDLARNANVPKRFWPATIENFSLEGSRKPMAPTVDRINRLVGYFPEKVPTGIILSGPVGTGKTHLAVCIVKAAIEELMTAYYTTTGDVLKELKAFWKSNSDKEKPLSLKSRFEYPAILVLDEIEHVETKKDIGYIDKLINRRWNDLKCVIVCTNLSLEDLRGRIGEPVFDRIADEGVALVFPDIESYRAEHKFDLFT
jgi:DNA replication protein DnaC